MPSRLENRSRRRRDPPPSLTVEEMAQGPEQVFQKSRDREPNLSQDHKLWFELCQSYHNGLRRGSQLEEFPYWVLHHIHPAIIESMLQAVHGVTCFRAIDFYGPCLEKAYNVPLWQFGLFFGSLSQSSIITLRKIQGDRTNLSFDKLYENMKRMRSKRTPFKAGPLEFERKDFSAYLNRAAGHDSEYEDEGERSLSNTAGNEGRVGADLRGSFEGISQNDTHGEREAGSIADIIFVRSHDGSESGDESYVPSPGSQSPTEYVLVNDASSPSDRSSTEGFAPGRFEELEAPEMLITLEIPDMPEANALKNKGPRRDATDVSGRGVREDLQDLGSHFDLISDRPATSTTIADALRSAWEQFEQQTAEHQKHLDQATENLDSLSSKMSFKESSDPNWDSEQDENQAKLASEWTKLHQKRKDKKKNLQNFQAKRIKLSETMAEFGL